MPRSRRAGSFGSWNRGIPVGPRPSTENRRKRFDWTASSWAAASGRGAIASRFATTLREQSRVSPFRPSASPSRRAFSFESAAPETGANDSFEALTGASEGFRFIEVRVTPSKGAQMAQDQTFRRIGAVALALAAGLWAAYLSAEEGPRFHVAFTTDSKQTMTERATFAPDSPK